VHRTVDRITRLRGRIRQHLALVRAQMATDGGFTAFEWAVGLVLTGSLILIVNTAANGKIAEKVAQIAGF
jgi:hypothetical protein